MDCFYFSPKNYLKEGILGETKQKKNQKKLFLFLEM